MVILSFVANLRPARLHETCYRKQKREIEEREEEGRKGEGRSGQAFIKTVMANISSTLAVDNRLSLIDTVPGYEGC